MSDCKQIAAMLSDYLDRDLPLGTCAVIETHLQTCPDCGAAEASLRKTVDLCRQYASDHRPGPLPPDKQRELRDVFERVLAQMRPR